MPWNWTPFIVRTTMSALEAVRAKVPIRRLGGSRQVLVNLPHSKGEFTAKSSQILMRQIDHDGKCELQGQPAKPNRASRSPTIPRHTVIRKRKRSFVLTLSESESTLCNFYRSSCQESSRTGHPDVGGHITMARNQHLTHWVRHESCFAPAVQTKSEGKNVRNGTC